MVYLTQFSIPALLNPMINKMTDEASAILLLICSHEVCVKVTYDCSTALCLCLCLCRPSFHQSKLRRKHKHNPRRTNFTMSVFLLLMRTSTQFSLAYTRACLCAYDYGYALVKTSLQSLMDVKRHRCTFSIHQNEKKASLDSREADRKISQNKTTNIEGKTNGV